MSDPHPHRGTKPESRQRHTQFDRRHLVLLLAALACIAGLVLFVAELDVGLDSELTPQNAPPESSSPQSPAPPAQQP
jgi:hypothetical protein